MVARAVTQPRLCASTRWRQSHSETSLRQGQRLRSKLRVDHAAGPAEPLLWLADIVAGAVREHRMDHLRHPEFASSVTIIEV